MISSAGEARSGHERTHDPCRTDLKDLTADEADGRGPRWLLPSCAGALLLGLALVLLHAF
ncbi:MAG: hypothetical protein ACJ71T_09205 [Actinomycetales bacterium]